MQSLKSDMSVPTDFEPSVLEMLSLRGRTALVTGVGGHLGLSLARALAEAGASVAVTSRDLSRAEALAGSLPCSDGAEHFGVALDQTDAASIDECIGEVLRRAHQIDVLVNNAHEPVVGDWQSVTPEDFQRHFTNVTGYFLLARHVRNHAVERRAPASVVMLGSMYGVVGSYPEA
jgi:gluconate 5-dehydrogenase